MELSQFGFPASRKPTVWTKICPILLPSNRSSEQFARNSSPNSEHFSGKPKLKIWSAVGFWDKRGKIAMDERQLDSLVWPFASDLGVARLVAHCQARGARHKENEDGSDHCRHQIKTYELTECESHFIKSNRSCDHNC